MTINDVTHNLIVIYPSFPWVVHVSENWKTTGMETRSFYNSLSHCDVIFRLFLIMLVLLVSRWRMWLRSRSRIGNRRRQRVGPSVCALPEDWSRQRGVSQRRNGKLRKDSFQAVARKALQTEGNNLWQCCYSTFLVVSKRCWSTLFSS